VKLGIEEGTDGKMSTGQRAVMLCGWGVKAGMACLQIKLYDGGGDLVPSSMPHFTPIGATTRV